MNVEEAREALKAAIRVGLVGTELQIESKTFALISCADAYGDARELKGHVEACGKANQGGNPADGPEYCGHDGWLCEQAQAIEQLGKEA